MEVEVEGGGGRECAIVPYAGIFHLFKGDSGGVWWGVFDQLWFFHKTKGIYLVGVL